MLSQQNFCRFIFIWISMLLITVDIHSQTCNDTIKVQCASDTISFFASRYRPAKANLIEAEIISFPIMVGALCVEGDKDEFSNLRSNYLPKFQSTIDNYSQFLPAAVMLGLKIGGVKGQSSWGRMLTADAFSIALMAGTVNALKYSVKSRRPDGSTRNSFPSGHTATAFMTATMLANEYGWRNPLISIGAYTSATFTGAFRMANNRHWLSDVLFGAGVDVLSTQLGYFLTDLIYKDRGLNKDSFHSSNLSKEDSPSFFGIYLGYDFPIGKYGSSVGKIPQHVSGGVTGLEGAYFFNSRWGIGGRFTAGTITFNEDVDDETIDNVAFMPGVYYSLPLSKHLSIETKLLAGWNLYTKTIFDGIRYKASNGMSVGTGINIKFRLNKSYDMRLFCDYNINSPYKPLFSNYMNHVAVGGSTSISF